VRSLSAGISAIQVPVVARKIYWRFFEKILFFGGLQQLKEKKIAKV
jgi:hypothetical protein